MKRIQDLRQVMQLHKIDAYIVPSTDEWRNEYTPNHKKRLEWISGFSGSNGVLIITKKNLILFTDSRYTAQAKVELSSDFQIIDMNTANAYDVMKKCKQYIVGYDPMIQTFKEVQNYEMLGKKFNFTLQGIDENLVDLLMNSNAIEVEEISEYIAYTLRQQTGEYESLEPQEYISFGAKVNGEYVGVVSLLLEYKNNAHIHWIGVLQPFHHQGVGKSLIDFAAKFVHHKGIQTITVKTQSSVDFFTTQGFTQLFNIQKVVYMIKSELLNSKKLHYSEIQNLPIKVTGMSVEAKIDLVLERLLSIECDGVIFTSPASICWLLNIRGNDIKYNPLLLCYAILNVNSKKIQLFINTSKPLEINYKLVETYPLDMFKKYIRQVNHLRLAFDQNNSAIWLTNNITQAISVQDPTVELRAIKSPIELDGFKKAHIYDGVAVCKFWFWLYNNIDDKIDEISATAKLSEFRGMSSEFVEESFGTISGYGSNGAIVHYQAKESTCKLIAAEGQDPIYLVDSGAHYRCAGTTDITRVFNIGKFVKGIKNEHKIAYTAILKGHIAIARGVFPIGTNGSQLDALARYYLWQKGLDYGHGTGHGVGHFSSVHEGPQGITKQNTVILKENMIVSIEPGYYKEGHFGMRIENLYAIKKSSKYNGFLEFEMLTMVPIETSLINFNEMNKDEIEWLAHNNRVAVEAVKNKLSEDELEFIVSNSTL